MGTSNTRPFERVFLAPTWPFGLDSVQGYLELAHWYDSKNVTFSCDPTDIQRFDSMYFQLVQIEKEGHLVIQWQHQTFSGREMLTIEQVALTTSGRKLLGELQAKSRWGTLKQKLVTIFWAALTSIVTTLAVLAVKGA